MLSKKLAAIAAVSLLTASSAAVAQTAQPLSLSQSPAARASADTSGQNSLEHRGYGMYLIGAIVVGLIIWGAIEVTNDNNNPHSP